MDELKHTVVANHIVHVPGRRIAVFTRVEDNGLPQNTRQTAEDAESSRTATNDNHIVVSLGGSSRKSNSDDGKEGVEDGRQGASHGGQVRMDQERNGKGIPVWGNERKRRRGILYVLRSTENFVQSEHSVNNKLQKPLQLEDRHPLPSSSACLEYDLQ